MRKFISVLCIATLLLNSSCKTPRSVVGTKDDGKIEVVFVQVNDVYEIAPVGGGKEGGMARVATLKKQYKQANPNTFLVIAGDFLSPSVYNSLQYHGKRIRGAQMVESMNAAGMDIAVFGNHEFDISEKELQERINESRFLWVSTNTFHKLKDSIVPFRRTDVANATPFPETYIMSVKDNDGTAARIGFIGLTLPSNPADFVSYKDPLAAAKEVYNKIKDSVDAVVAITHMAVEDDVLLAKELPGLAAIIGGHEHGGVFNKTGKVYITKAHANARSAYIVKLDINKNKRSFNVPEPELKYINEEVALDSNTNVAVEKWKKIARDNYASLGFDAEKVVIATGEKLDGRETETRSTSTNLTSLVTAAMAYACPQADVVIFNSGSIRLDDILTPPVTQYDIIRTLPFGGGIREVDMKGDLLLKVLQAGIKNRNNGGFLQSQPVVFNSAANSFTVNNQAIDPTKVYRVAVTEFLLSGKEANLDFLNETNPGIVKVYPAETEITNPKSDIRAAIVKFLSNKK
ncbi:bifunctional metallophosphatase/5'-nucleotidase [Segetibacter aerophilus]|uniref:Multifunctional 2',3'-cyclic-nucleotide 2'-phosphodiesterase/5'-nucleotidase/3'-nucleotidase n=1 Tax=Segetibacter aerophilus TaxID=670293 RepID=A0A512BJC5_9BACT|nr:bifunctional metallophosphatase/5'-nucleotidase [Segetibacter aerophilus]GEO12066.1 multifunctional 2',3'-cyclic-nucleotide 2'-phosphodiesterase/5'-nucleotidase/3'-nucleotidase [Segetibacter aerophilus]